MTDLQERCRSIRLVLVDVDGVLTDGGICYDGEGRETKVFHVHDGSGAVYLRQAGILTGAISGRDSAAVRQRMADMGLEHVVLGKHRKLPAYEQILADCGLDHHQVAYIGDDLLDLCILTRVGLAVTVPEGRPEVRQVCHHVTRTSAGRGVLRELAELVLKAQGRWDALVEEYDA